jgi:hypothetical protein
MDNAHPQTVLGTTPQPRRAVSLPVSGLWAPVSREAMGGEVCPALNSRRW